MMELKLWNSCFKSFLHCRPIGPISNRLVVSSIMYSKEAFIISYQKQICSRGGLDHLFHQIILASVNDYPLPSVLIVKSPYTQFFRMSNYRELSIQGFYKLIFHMYSSQQYECSCMTWMIVGSETLR